MEIPWEAIVIVETQVNIDLLLLVTIILYYSPVTTDLKRETLKNRNSIVTRRHSYVSSNYG